MARWKRALPEGQDPAVVQFVVQLRRMKDDSGLTLQQLAARTGYSASSWERYLGGRLLPPAEAVEALAQLVGLDPVRLLARHARAADAWQAPQADDAAQSGPQEGADELDEEPSALPRAAAQPVAEGRFRQALPFVLTAVFAAAGGAGIALLVTQPSSSSSSTHQAATTASTPYTCTYTQRGGLWYAGDSDSTAPLQVDDSGPEVAELQCLLQHAGFSPGGIDGNFGPLTESAVIQEQKARHLDIDGQVGPATWKSLRG